MKRYYKVFCRGFQLGMRIVLPLMPYREPDILDSVRDIPKVLKKKKIHSVLIITDKKIREFGLTTRLEESLRDAELDFTIFDKTTANPTTQNVEDALALYYENNCKALIGFGGGSCMDCAKAVGARVARPKKTLAQMKGILKIRRPIPTLFAIPTTAGTGSEATLAMVITDSETRHKYPANDFPLIPKYAVLDPKVTRSLPPFVTATTGMDALTHAVEAYIGHSTTKRTRRESRKAVKLIFENIDKAYQDGNDIDARKRMLLAAYYAGCAFTRSYVGYVHAVAHQLGGEYNIPHGYANALLLPLLLEEYGERIYPKLKDLAIMAGLATDETDKEEAAKAFIQAIKDMKQRFGIGDTFPELKEEDIPKLAKYAHAEGNPLYPVPKLMDAKELEKFYYMTLEKEGEQ